MNYEYDICIIGTLCDTDLVMAEHLAMKGLKPIVVRKKDEKSLGIPKKYLKHFDQKNCIIVNNSIDFLKYAKRSCLILSITGALIRHLKYLWPARHLLKLPPVINLTTGSDITESAGEKTLEGFFYRQYLRYSKINWCLPMPHALDNLRKHKINNVVFMEGFPYLSPEISKPKIFNEKKNKIKFFHCSNFDWNFSDFRPDRNSIKGNDKFLRAVIRIIKEGYDFELIMLDRGPDRNIAKKMCRKAGVYEKIKWKTHLSRDELIDEILTSDVVINMFAHGGAGGISYESLKLGTPVMQYANPLYFKLMYGDTPPPFINCHSEDDIYLELKNCLEGCDLKEISEQGKKWIDKHISPTNSLDHFLTYYSILTGKEVIDFGPHIKLVQEHSQKVMKGIYDPYEGLED